MDGRIERVKTEIWNLSRSQLLAKDVYELVEEETLNTYQSRRMSILGQLGSIVRSRERSR